MCETEECYLPFVLLKQPKISRDTMLTSLLVLLSATVSALIKPPEGTTDRKMQISGFLLSSDKDDFLVKTNIKNLPNLFNFISTFFCLFSIPNFFKTSSFLKLLWMYEIAEF